MNVNYENHITSKVDLDSLELSITDICTYCGYSPNPLNKRYYGPVSERCQTCRVYELYNQAHEEVRIMKDTTKYEGDFYSIIGCNS